VGVVFFINFTALDINIFLFWNKFFIGFYINLFYIFFITPLYFKNLSPA